MNIENKTLLITGANRGIGRALTDEALARGARRVHAGSRSPLRHPDPRVTPLILDVTRRADVERVAELVAELDVLVNNAGVMVPDEPFDADVLEHHLAVHLHGAHAMTQALIPRLVSSKGAVVNMLSCVALAPLPMFTSYSISKAAAFSMTKTLRAGFAGQGVTFHAVLAGPIDTDMTRSLPIPKTAPAAAAAAILDAVQEGVEDIFPDAATVRLAPAWAAGADRILEQQFALLASSAPR